MTRFRHLKKLEPSQVARFSLPEVSPDAVLVLRHAGETNRRYTEAVVERAAARVRQQRGRSITPNANMIDQERDEARELFARFVLHAWEGIEDENGEAVPFSVDHAREFLAALPAWLFDRVRQFANNPRNFTAEDEPEVPSATEAADLGKL